MPPSLRSEYRAVADDLDGRRAVGAGARARSRGRPPRFRPAGPWRAGRRWRPCPAAARTISASRSSSATVSARHSTTSVEATSCSALGLAGIAQAQDARVDEQPAIAIFGKARQAIDVGHLDAGRLQRLDQRVGQPLRQLVQRHEPGRRIVRGRAPDGASSRPAARRPAPAATARSGPGGADSLAGWRAPASGRPRQRRPDGRTARPGAASSTRAKTSGLAATVAPSRRSRSARPCEARQRVGVAHLEVAAQRRRRPGLAAPLHRRAGGGADRDENAPSANMARLASASPSDRPTPARRSRRRDRASAARPRHRAGR